MKKPVQRDLFSGALETMILRERKRQPMPGFALDQHIKRTPPDLLQIEEGSLYPALQRLLQRGVCHKPSGASLPQTAARPSTS